MNSESHDLQKLLLDFKDLPNLESAVEEAYSKIDGRISYIVDNATVRGTPIVKMILQYTNSAADLEMLSEALKRLSELLPRLEEIESKRSLVKGISQQKGWLAAQLGNFTNEIDLFITSALETEGAS